MNLSNAMVMPETAEPNNLMKTITPNAYTKEDRSDLALRYGTVLLARTLTRFPLVLAFPAITGVTTLSRRKVLGSDLSL